MRATSCVPIIRLEFLLKLFIKCGLNICVDNETKILEVDVSQRMF
jgi:hypothetical protein